VEGVHPVHLHSFEAIGVGLDDVEEADGLAVGQER